MKNDLPAYLHEVGEPVSFLNVCASIGYSAFHLKLPLFVVTVFAHTKHNRYSLHSYIGVFHTVDYESAIYFLK